MTGPTRTKTKSADAAAAVDPGPLKAPRPPNSWIIYRSDKMHQMFNSPDSPYKKGAITQAEISKKISDMWKHEPDHVRQDYERRAEIKKAEHYARFPNYRFQPVKKEEKARERAAAEARREEKAAAKAGRRREKGSGKSNPVDLTHSPHSRVASSSSSAMPYVPRERPGSPSRDHRFAAAAEPVTPVRRQQQQSTVADTRRYGLAGPSPPLSAASTPEGSPRIPTSPLEAYSHHPSFPPIPHSARIPSVSYDQVPASHTSPNYYHQPDHLSPVASSPDAVHLTIPSSEQLVQQDPSCNPFGLLDGLSYTNSDWGLPPYFMDQFGNDSFGATATPTMDPGMSVLHSIDGGPFNIPSGELQLSSVNQGLVHSNYADFSHFNFGGPSDPSSPTDNSIAPLDIFAPAPQSASSTMPDFNHYIDTPASSSDIPSQHPSPQDPQPQPPRLAYAPPTGASHANMRRAGGSWRPPATARQTSYSVPAS